MSRATLAALSGILPSSIFDNTAPRRLLAALPILVACAREAVRPYASPELVADLEDADPVVALTAALAIAKDRGEVLPLEKWLSGYGPGNPGKSKDGPRKGHEVSVGDTAWSRLQAEARRRSQGAATVSVSDLVEELGLSFPAVS